MEGKAGKKGTVCAMDNHELSYNSDKLIQCLQTNIDKLGRHYNLINIHFV